MEENMKYDVIIPTAGKDINLIEGNSEFYLRNLGADNIFIITSKKNFREIPGVFFLDEDQILSFTKSDLDNYFLSRIGSAKRSGWYYQQFLKLGFSFISKNKFYLSWDADTIPLRKIAFFKKGIPLFNVKSEFNEPYFETMERCFNLKKSISKSFISEHMVFNKEYVIEMLNLAGSNPFYKILDSVSLADLPKSGFSEFETYGTFLCKYHPNDFKIRHLRTLRNGSEMLSEQERNNCQILEYFGKSFDTILFEDWSKQKSKNGLISNKAFRFFVNPNFFVFFSKRKK